MTKQPIVDRAGIDRLLKQGRGQGTLARYRPWITAKKSRSIGNVFRVWSHLTGRMHEFLSLLEYSVFMQLIRGGGATEDVREQYPLLDVEDTVTIAAALAVDHPSYSTKIGGVRETIFTVMTTDFLVTLPGERILSLAAKYRSELSDDRVQEKLQIERSYADSRGWSWQLVTEDQIPAAFLKNIQQFVPVIVAEEYQISDEHLEMGISTIAAAFYANPAHAIVEIAKECEEEVRLNPGMGLRLFWHAVAVGLIEADLYTEIDTLQPLKRRVPPVLEALT
jgi:hypothetical protein